MHRSRTSLATAATAAGMTLFFSLIALPASAAEPTTWPMTPSEQRYATAWGADPYQDKDLHVSLADGTPQAVSFLAFDLSAIPAGSTIAGLTVTLTPNASPYNVSGGRQTPPLVNACLETQPFPAQFDPSSSRMPWDCAKLSVAAELGSDGTWGVDLTPFVDEWLRNGNTGLALVGARSAEPADNWVLSFDRTKTAGTVAYTVPAVAPAAQPSAEPVPQVAPMPAPIAAPPVSPTTQLPVAPEAPAAIAPAEQQEVAASSAPPVWTYGFVALWAACAAAFAVGVVMKLRASERFTPRALASGVRRALHQKSTWLAGVPLLVIVGPGGGAFAYLQYLNAHVTPPLTFDGGAQPGMPAVVPGSSVNTRADDQAVAVQPARADVPVVAATRREEATPNELDGRWTVAAGSVAGYRVGYSSPTGRGTRVGRTENSEGVDGEIRIAGTAVRTARFTVDMRKVYCDGGSQCTDHVNQMMDTANHPIETFVLTSPIEVGSIPADGQQVGASVTGRLTLRGVTRTVTFTLNGRRSGERIEVLGSIPVNRDDYEIPDPEEPGFVIDKDGTIEILLVLERAG